MNAWLKIVLIFILFVGSISTVALLVDSESPAPLPTQEPILFDSEPEPEPTPTVTEAPPEEPVAAPASAPRSAPAAEPEPTPRRISGSSTVDVDAGHVEEGASCGGSNRAKGKGGSGSVEIDEDGSSRDPDEDEC